MKVLAFITRISVASLVSISLLMLPVSGALANTKDVDRQDHCEAMDGSRIGVMHDHDIQATITADVSVHAISISSSENSKQHCDCSVFNCICEDDAKCHAPISASLTALNDASHTSALALESLPIVSADTPVRYGLTFSPEIPPPTI